MKIKNNRKEEEISQRSLKENKNKNKRSISESQ
jgi:hypothetical protein